MLISDIGIDVDVGADIDVDNYIDIDTGILGMVVIIRRGGVMLM